MSSGVAQHHPTDSRCFHSHEIITTTEGDSTLSPKARGTMQMDGSLSWGLSWQHSFMLSSREDWEVLTKVLSTQESIPQSCTSKGFPSMYKLTGLQPHGGEEAQRLVGTQSWVAAPPSPEQLGPALLLTWPGVAHPTAQR